MTEVDIASPPTQSETNRVRHDALRSVVTSLLTELKNGAADREKRRQVEDWMKSLSEKYPDFEIHRGLRDYYLAEAERLKKDFESVTELTEKLNLGRSIEMFFDKAAECDNILLHR